MTKYDVDSNFKMAGHIKLNVISGPNFLSFCLEIENCIVLVIN